MPRLEYTRRSCIIVVHAPGEAGLALMGLVVDGVAEALSLTEDDIEETPDLADAAARGFCGEWPM